MATPYAKRALFLHGLNVLCIGFIAAYRGELYDFPASAWGLSAALGLLGLLAPLGLSGRMRAALLAGRWPLVFVIPVLGLILSPHLLPSPGSVGPFLFCVGASLTTCVVVLWNTSRRKRSVRRLLERPDVLDPALRPKLEAYFAAQTPVVERAAIRTKALHRALRAQAWVSTKRRRLRAAALLRECADFIDEPEPVFPLASDQLDGADGRRASHERLREALLGAAARLEHGGRILLWRSWLRSLSAADFDADRDSLYAIDQLTRRHDVARPKWFRGMCHQLARSPLTETDVTPSWNVAAPLAKALTVLVAVIVVANVALSTATAQPPLDDARELPVIAGPSAKSHIEPRLSRVAGSLAGHRVEARCWSEDDWQRLTAQRASWIRGSQRRLGRWGAYASIDHDRANFAPAICASLARLTHETIPVESDRWPGALAWSVAALAHESEHLSGIRNEAKAECYGMQFITVATKSLGRTEREGRYLASLYWEAAYHRHSDPAYVSDECRDGGALDLRPEIPDWP